MLFVLFSFIAKAQLDTTSNQKTISHQGRVQRYLHDFDAQKIQNLKMVNQHGYINIATWDKESIEFEIIIRVETRSEALAEEVFDLISIDNRTYSNTLSFKTLFSEDFFSNHPFSINYLVKIPARLNLNIDNSIGDVRIDSVQGQVRLKHQYGKLELRDLAIDKQHELDLSFIEGLVETFGNAKVNLSNCTLNFNDGKRIIGNSKYCMETTANVNAVNLKTSTDRLTVTNADSVILKGEQFIGKIDQLNTHLFCELEKGQLLVSTSESIKDITISNNNVNTTLIIPHQTSYQLNGEVTRGNFIHPNPKQLSLIKENERVSFSGSIGDASSPHANLILFNRDSSITIKN